MQTPFVLPEVEAGIVTLWSGSILSIPSGWALCDGNNGTPDLRNKFEVGAGSAYAVDAFGGAIQHTHPFTGDGHYHTLAMGTDINPGPGIQSLTTDTDVTGTTDQTSNLPTYYALAYIMKL